MNKNWLYYALENNLTLTSVSGLLFLDGLLLWYGLVEDLLDIDWKMPFSSKEEIKNWHKN